MCSHGGYFAVFQDYAVIASGQCGHPVGDHQSGLFLPQFKQAFQYAFLRVGIHSGQGIVQYQYGWVGNYCPGNGNALFLTTGQGNPLFAHQGFQTIGKPGHIFFKSGNVHRLVHLVP